MSLMFKPPAKDRNFDPNLVQVMLNENALLIKIVADYQNKGLSDFQADESFSPHKSQNDLTGTAKIMRHIKQERNGDNETS